MTDNQDSVTADAAQPPTDRPLTAGDVPLLREGDLVAPVSDLTDYRGGKLPAGVPVPVLNVSSDGYIRVTDPERGHLSYAFTFVSRPATSAASEAGWSPVNVNDTVQVRLTDLGRETHKAYWEPFSAGNYRPVKVDGDGWSEFQLWDLMAVFGPKIRMGMDVPFETTIRVKTPALASPPVSERERELEGALRLAASAIGCLTFDDEVRSIIGNTNFEILKANAAEIRRLTAQPAGEGK